MENTLSAVFWDSFISYIFYFILHCSGQNSFLWTTIAYLKKPNSLQMLKDVPIVSLQAQVLWEKKPQKTWFLWDL